jgi:hypothetical protein
MIPAPLVNAVMLLLLATAYLFNFVLRHRTEPKSSIFGIYSGVGLNLVNRSPSMVRFSPMGMGMKIRL